MNKNRLEAFSDGVLAIIITIMVLEIKIPHGEANLQALMRLLPIFVSYVLSFVYIAIYWNNHHHMLHGTEKVNGAILWANMHLLFWLSLVPFTTGWMGENDFAPITMTAYGVILFMSGLAYNILQNLIAKQDENKLLKQAIGSDRKGKISTVLYAVAIAASFYSRWIAGIIYIAVALMWLIPDKRIEHEILDNQD
ncbi:MAG TPA: TMEM175 family protein [Flavobacterium sp.]|jgi:uncharacterized membrane protein